MDKFMSEPSSELEPRDEVRVPLFRDEILDGTTFGLGLSPSGRVVVLDEKEDRKSSEDETDLERGLFFNSCKKKGFRIELKFFYLTCCHFYIL